MKYTRNMSFALAALIFGKLTPTVAAESHDNGFLTNEDILQLVTDRFEVADANDDGILSKTEAETIRNARQTSLGINFFQRCVTYPVTLEDMQSNVISAFEEIDLNEDEVLTRHEVSRQRRLSFFKGRNWCRES